MSPMRRLFAASLLAFTLNACGAAPDAAPPAVSPETVDGGASAPSKSKITAPQMLGQSDAWLRQHLGEPHFARADLNAHIWQYKNGHCVLNVFLYPDGADAPSPARVLHFDARDLGGRNTDRAQCLSLLQD